MFSNLGRFYVIFYTKSMLQMYNYISGDKANQFAFCC